MTTSIGEIVRQLRTAIKQLDEAAVVAGQARVLAERAHARYAEAAKGSRHPRARGAKQQSRIAADKTGRLGKLIAEAANALTRYVNHIAPGTLPARTAPTAMLSGDRMADAGSGRGSLSRKLLRRATTVKNADDGLQHAKKLADSIQQAAGSGGVAEHRPPPPAVPVDNTRGATAGDVLFAALILTMVGVKGVKLAASFRHKLRLSEDGQHKEGDNRG